MAEDLAHQAAEAREAANFRARMATARERQYTADARAPGTARFLLASARSMAAHMAMSEQRMQDCLAPMALWQLYLPSALNADIWDFAAVREQMPWSYERVRTALAPLKTRPQLVSTLFHMAAFPLVAVLVGAVWRDMHDGPLHLLVARQNMSWFRVGNNRWVSDAVTLIGTDPTGLRQLVAGLNNGSIRRLLILADGPHVAGGPATRTLHGISPTLAIKTMLLARLHTLGIPLVAITHEWDEDRLVVTTRVPLDPAVLGQADTIDAIVGHLEDLLRRHPEQWLNWSAASIRT